MCAMVGINPISFGNLTINNRIYKKDFNNSLLNRPSADTISFEGNTHHYTGSQRNLMNEMKEVSVGMELPDFLENDKKELKRTLNNEMGFLAFTGRKNASIQ